MIERLKNTKKDQVIAIAASGPSVMEYDIHEHDYLIGVKMAGKLLKKGDLFLSADEKTHTRSWFKKLDPSLNKVMRAESAIYLEEFYPNIKIRNLLCNEYEALRDRMPNTIIELKDGYKKVYPGHNPYLDDFLENLPPCDTNHFMINRMVQGEPIGNNQKILNWGGTSSCVALQLAIIMGAREVHLYGVEFSNDKGNNYFNKLDKNEAGYTTEGQKIFMDNIVYYTAKKLGIKVYSHGYTNLKNTIKV